MLKSALSVFTPNRSKGILIAAILFTALIGFEMFNIKMHHSPIDLFYVIDGVDERGQTWSGVQEVTSMIAEAIYLQMASQLGRKGDNAFDNVDEALAGITPNGHGTFLASFGLGYLEFPAPAVARLCTHWLLTELIEQQWLNPNLEGTAAESSHTPLTHITTAQLLPHLRLDEQTGTDLHIDCRQPSWLAEKPHDEIPAEASRYVRDYGQARVIEGALSHIERNAQKQIAAQHSRWASWINALLFTPQIPLPILLTQLKSQRETIRFWVREGETQAATLSDKVSQQQLTMTHQESTLTQATGGLPFGRSGRIRKALGRYFQAAQEFYESRLQETLLQAQLKVWRHSDAELSQLITHIQLLIARLEALATQLTLAADDLLHRCQAGGVSRLSLADEAYIKALYQRVAPERVNLRTTSYFTSSEAPTPLELIELTGDQLGELLLNALSEKFQAIKQMDIETILLERSQEMSHRARRQQLFNLATPSWSIDRARLPEGGSTLVRLEVMGVPDDGRTLFQDETMVVSTYDPYRLTALVVVAGAPKDALQQHDLYERALERIRNIRPVYVLPHFLANANQTRLAFALGSIFDLITNQGTYFYYQPSDELESPLKLGNGLAKAIQGMATQDGLTREIMERIDGVIAQRGLAEVIDLLTNYYTISAASRSSLDELTRELKQLVRSYADELRQINEFSNTLGR